MYDHVVGKRSGLGWQAALHLGLHRSELKYDETVWGEDMRQAYADEPYPARPDDFLTDTYTSVTQTLTEQARLSLALLQEQEAKAAFDNLPTPPKTSASVNEHLPFVMDDYAAARRIKVLLAKGLLNKTSTGRFVEDISTAKPDFKTNQEERNSLPSHLEATKEALDAVDDETLSQAEKELQAEPEPQAEIETIAEMPSISLEEISQREEAQFAKGLAQGLEEGKAQGFEEGKAQGFEVGKAQGFEEGRALGFEDGKGHGLEEAVQKALEEGRAQGLQEGMAKGIEQGERQAREAMEQEVATQCKVLSQVAEGLHDLLQDPQRFFNPLKRLALNMAQQIAKHELSTSPQAIDALVQNCLNELDHPIKGAVIVELNPQDKKLLETLATASLQGVHLEAVPQLTSGSVRVIANDMVVEDLIENRLEALTRGLLLKEMPSMAHQAAENNQNQKEVTEEKLPDAKDDGLVDDGEVDDVHT